MSVAVITPKKLIEVALPLDKINIAAAREKSIRHGHPSTLHLWWARRPLAAARAVIFGQLVNDPSWRWELEHPTEAPPSHLKATWAKSRKRLFLLLEELVKWEATTNEQVLDRARAEIQRSWAETCEVNKLHPDAATLFNPDVLPGLHDPFAGGGAIPLEAQRLGIDSFASDLNPVAVIINKAMIETPPKFSGLSPVNSENGNQKTLIRQDWKRAEGIAEDVRYYARLMRDEAERRVGQYYPKIEVGPELTANRPDLENLEGASLTVVAWIWSRTVKSPNPGARSAHTPLASSFLLATKKGAETWVDMNVCNETSDIAFKVKRGDCSPSKIEKLKLGTKSGKAKDFICAFTGTPIPRDYIQAEGKAGRLGQKLMAIVAEGPSGRVYLSPSPHHEAVAKSLDASPMVSEAYDGFMSGSTPTRAMITGGVCSAYGLERWSQLFTSRQIVLLSTLSDIVADVRERVKSDAVLAGLADDDIKLEDGGLGAQAYADSIAIYLAFAIDKVADRGSSLGRWDPTPTQSGIINTFSRQALPMTWDFAESNPLGGASGNLVGAAELVAKAILNTPAKAQGNAVQFDAQSQKISKNKIVSTDPPYYNNINYSDLSDFFYVWLRRSLRPVMPKLFSTIAVPKAEELVAIAYRHGGKEAAEKFFLDGMTEVMASIAKQAHPAFPVTIYYAFKQSETEGSTGTSSTGWETFLEAVIRAGFALTGTWPMRTELGNRMIGSGANALASSIILVCRQRGENAATTSRRAFLRELNTVLPEALDQMTRGSGDDVSPVAPVDLSQAIIGPGMAIFSKYAGVVEADGSAMTVKSALRLINSFLAEDDFDPDTQFCLHWFEQHGWTDGSFGEADQLARAKGTAVNGVEQAGVVEAGGGKVRLLRPTDYQSTWQPESDLRLPVWEVLHQLIRVFRATGYEGAAVIVAAVSSKADAARQLAYRLYTLCERKGWSEDARAYNEIITSWAAIEDAASRAPKPRQTNLFDA